MESLLQRIFSEVTAELALQYNEHPHEVSIEEVQDLVVLALQKIAHQAARAVSSECREVDVLTRLVAAMKPWESSLGDEQDDLLPFALMLLKPENKDEGAE